MTALRPRSLPRRVALLLLVTACAEPPATPTGPPPEAAPAARTVSAPVAASAQVRPPPGFPTATRDCPGCYLAGHDLRDVDLSGADLHGADLSRADLRDANLRDADLTTARLAEARLTGVDLTGADLRGAGLGSVDLGGVTWTDGRLCAPGSSGVCASAATAAAGFDVADGSGARVRGKVSKWYGGRRAAVSITYDSAYGTWVVHETTADMVLSRGLRMDHEIVTAFYGKPGRERLVQRLHTHLIDRGLGLFGHGHVHVNHDSLSYLEAYNSMHRCFMEMERMGFRPRAYAYPYSAGYEAETQRACRDAGFICARGSTLNLDEVYICPLDETEPDNWYYLPAVSMARNFPGYVNGHDQLRPVLDETEAKGAWVILMYHAIGMEIGWGYYPLAEFGKDLDQIAAGDFWSANMDAAAAYVQERNAARVRLHAASATAVTLSLEDGLDDAVYDQPLTLALELPAAVTGVSVELHGAVEQRAAASGRVLVDLRPDGRPVTLHLEPASP